MDQSSRSVQLQVLHRLGNHNAHAWQGGCSYSPSMPQPLSAAAVCGSSLRLRDFSSFGDSRDYESLDEEECGTPKSSEHRIPEAPSCPPPPRKPRALKQTRVMAPGGFFTPPDLEIFLLEQDATIRK
ncbi:hypothetical protein O6H91_03G072000 [Diphasiastrum complanatum]|uniref:Uncharacterized protein n=1 Tax=Diphasiastrum complanatum TaxID=34168 RepID=A0ACC2E7S2_DIPCM|nr:hypothetical protein O6H91_03G072000 [Diphasiastrum complanatum]